MKNTYIEIKREEEIPPFNNCEIWGCINKATWHTEVGDEEYPGGKTYDVCDDCHEHIFRIYEEDCEAEKDDMLGDQKNDLEWAEGKK